MISNITPTKRRASRSYSSSSLHPLSTASHTRRPSRTSLTHSHSTTILLPSSPATPTIPVSPARRHHPLSIPRIVAAVDAFLPRRIRRARLSAAHADRQVIIALAVLFLLVFILLFIVLKSLLPTSTNLRDPWIENIKRINQGLSPRQTWPSQYARTQALYQLVNPPKPYLTDRDSNHVISRRLKTKSFSNPPLISIVAACRDRSAFLQTVLPDWLKALPQNGEVILVDWGTLPPDHVPLDVIAKATNDPRITVATLKSSADWVLSRAYNLGFSLAAGQWILKLDCDTQLGPNFFQQHPLDSESLISSASNTKASDKKDSAAGQRRARELLTSNTLPNPPVFYRAFWELARNENEQHLAGIFLARKQHIDQIYGYDERITTYGWDDSDIYSRLESRGVSDDVGLIPIPLDLDSIKHIRHDDDLRGANQRLVSGPTLETQINAQATETLPLWTKVASEQRSIYKFDLLSRDARFLDVKISHSPKPIIQQLTTTDRQRIITEATNRVLHDTYGFPWVVLTEINRSRQELVRSLTALGRSTHWQSANGFIFAEVGGSVPNRILAVASAVALAMKYDRPLFLAWNSGSREDPTPRIMDFFDVDAITEGLSRDFPNLFSSRPRVKIYQVGRWRCRSAIMICSQHDPAYSMMAEYRSGTHPDDTKMAQAVLDVLEGRVPGKRNVLLRLEGAFPLQTMKERTTAFSSLHPSVAVTEQISLLGNQSERMGIYVGHTLKEKGVEAMTKRVQSHHPTGTKYFVTGAVRDIVKMTRVSLDSDDFPEIDTQVAGLGSAREVRETRRDIAELYALASCKSMVNDARPPRSVLDVVDILTEIRSSQEN